MIECPKCGYLNADGAQFCQNPTPCGTFVGYTEKKVAPLPGGVLLVVSPAMVAVAPGSEAVVDIRVRNKSQIVDQYQIQVVGEPSKWTLAEPSTLSLFPDAEGLAKVRFRPVRSPEVTAGRKPYSIVVQSKASPNVGADQDGAVEVAPFQQSTLAIVPRTARGGTSAIFRITVENQGNVPLQATLEGVDPDDLLSFSFDRPAVLVAPGGSAYVQLTVQPRATFYDGPPQPHPFKIQLTGAGAPPVTADAIMLQEPIPQPVPRKFPLIPVLVALLAVVLLGTAAFAHDAIGTVVAQMMGGRQTTPTTGKAATAASISPSAPPSATPSPTPVVLVNIPNTRCMTALPAQQAIEAAGFRFAGRFQKNQFYPNGTAFDTQPSGQAPKGSEVTVLISTGADPNGIVGLNPCRSIIKQLPPDFLNQLRAQVTPSS